MTGSIRLAARGAGLPLLVGGLVLLLGVGPAWAGVISSSPDTGTWGTDGRIWAMVSLGDTVYVGGTFTAAVAPDGTTVPRSNLAAFDAETGALDLAWNPGVDAVVYALATDGDEIYVGGDFTLIGGEPRDRMAAVDPVTGAVDAFRADATRKVRALALDGSILYMGGQFGRVDDRRRIRLAAVDLTTGTLVKGFKPEPNHSVLGLAVEANHDLVAGGIFDMISDSPAEYIAELGPDGALRPWQDHPVDLVWSVEVVDGRVYAGRGGSLGGGIIGYDENGVQLFNRHANGDVQDLAYANGQIIVAGHFSTLGRLEAPKLAALSTSGVVDPSWVPRPNSRKGVWAVDASATKLYAGGDFTKVNGQPVSRYAQFAIA